MSNGYGYGYGNGNKNAVSPYQTGGYGNANANWNYPGVGGQMNPPVPMPLPAPMPYPVAQPAAQALGGAQMMPPVGVPSGSFVTPAGGNVVTVPVVEESYVENILRLNRGKLATFYMTYENNREWNAKVFKGKIEAAGRDHIIISDPTTGMRYLLLTLNLDYVTFDEPIAYEYAFQGNIISNLTPTTVSGSGTAAVGTISTGR
ncbi:spore coat protein GerQ [Paenibacillus sp. GCM10023252]|uniref:spore coat protein GerQ n=1 Tax=Paenibacillus sp. GCM10023252 TaxID=3252649 RepID=UPI003617C135